MENCPYEMTSSHGMFSKHSREKPAPCRPWVLVEPRVPRAVYSSRPSLTCLGDDIVAIIADLLQHTSPSSISSLALVCSNYYRIARYAQHRHLVLDNTRDTQKLENVMKSGTPGAIRHLEVRGNASNGVISRLCKVIPKMTGLKDVTWSATGIPGEVLQLLRKRPSIRLHTVAYHDHGPYGSGILEGLQANNNLVSISVDFNYHSAEECQRWTRPLKKVLLSCPNLRNLTLDSSRRRNGCGCVLYSSPSEYCGFGFSTEERLPALEELHVREYTFGVPALESPYPNFHLPWSQGYPLKVDERDYWADNFDWSRLTCLTTCDTRFALKIMPYLTSLKEFACINNWGPMKTFYEQVPSSLESINVPHIATIGLQNLLRHRRTLKKLTIHQEGYTSTWRERAIDAKTLITIRDNCPHIEELSLNISRDGEWPYEMLDILAGFGSLRVLKIWFELGNASNPVQPYVNFSAVGSLFKYLHEHATGRRHRLTKLEIASGWSPALGHGLPGGGAFWPACNSSNFVCILSDRDGEAEKGIFSVRCTTLSQEQNEYLKRAGDGKEDLNCQFSKNEAFRVARYGPIPMRKWKFSHYKRTCDNLASWRITMVELYQGVLKRR
ncbi:hypothetical protein F5Y06DRAFT_256088 [Hypoxylon sp. FL0890]|nr:hypothetical protein F5Y06DRAFT_256088 [Hypoxylon sp. FL0890]